jgi:hypothetical protein
MQHTIKAYGGMEVQLLTFLTLALEYLAETGLDSY